MAYHTFTSNTIFREYDIRGVFNQTLKEEDAYFIGINFTLSIGKKNPTIILARDGRNSSPLLHQAVIKGIIAAGGDIIDIGVFPTPVMYFANHYIESDAGIMITGSHNPPDHNGFKMVKNKKALHGSEIKALANIDFTPPNRQGLLLEVNIAKLENAYINHISSALTNIRPLKIAWDPANGAACDILTKIVGRLQGAHILINAKIDGNFPSHPADPTIAENLEQLIAVVKEQKCDLGIAFDGDGDRLGVVDAKGRILYGDHLLTIFAREILQTNPGSIIIADVKTGNHFFDEVKKHQGIPLMWKTGHSLIKAKMAETGAILAGEMSGHIFFADNFGYDDGIYAAVRLINILSNYDINLTTIYDNFPKSFASQEIRFECLESEKDLIINHIKTLIKASYPTTAINEIDGIRLTTEDGWLLFRASNTQNIIVSRVEASDQAGLDILQSKLDYYLDSISSGFGNLISELE